MIQIQYALTYSSPWIAYHDSASSGPKTSRCYCFAPSPSHEDRDVVLTSSKKPSLLRRHAVNDCCRRGLVSVKMAQYPNVHFAC